MKRIGFSWLWALFVAAGCQTDRSGLVFNCEPDNDLYRAVISGGERPQRFDTPKAAIDAAPAGAGVLLLSEPAVDAALLDKARQKRLRLFIENPKTVPGVTFGEPRTAVWERVVVASDELGSDLPPMRILSAHGCAFRPTASGNAVLVLARVAGFDSAVYGLPREQFPLLFRITEGHLVATAKMSNFVTARYAPARQWELVWEHVLQELGAKKIHLTPQPTVRAAYAKSARLPKDAEAQSLARFAKWIDRSGLLIPRARERAVHEMLKGGVEVTAPPAADEPPGDGSLGMMEGFASQIRPDGGQMRRTPLRADCVAEMAMVLALHSSIAGDERSQAVAKNLLDYVYFKSGMHGGVRGDPNHPAFGLIAWGAVSPAWEVANYGDDNARTLLGTIFAAACFKSHAWDEAMLKGLLANLRTTGKFGFRGDRIDIPQLEQRGWRHFHEAETVNYALNFEAYLWACYLWAYRETGEQEFLDKARTAIGMTMKAYPKGWRWADNMERARILLPLAWLVRADDTPQHRAWLATIACDLIANQDSCGAIPEQLGGEGKGGGHYVVPASNEAYGTTETPLIQSNGDRVSDQLYTAGFALIGLHEAAVALDDPKLRDAADKLAEFLVRIQVRSEKLPYLDGAWFRAFDFGKWDYWASSADIGWGAWSVEAGWCPAWAAATFGLRAKRTSMWDLTADSRIAEHLPTVKPLMAK